MRLWHFGAVLIIILAVPFVGAAIESTCKCSHPACLEGTDVNFTVTIQNNLKDNIVIDDIYIKDVETGQVLAIDAHKAKIIPPNDTEEFVLASTVKAPVRGYTFYYVPCFKAQSFNQKGVTGQGDVCGKIIRSLTVVPLNKVECRTDDECNQSEYCNTHSIYKCRPLDCLDNQTIESHNCIDLTCNLSQNPKGHQCVYNKALFVGLTLIAIIVLAFLFVMLGSRKPKRKRK